MIFQSIWERYFLREFLKVFFFFLFAFYGLYVLIDYASRINMFHNLRGFNTTLVQYYLYIFILRLDILIPFGLLIATVRTLCHLNAHNELIALLASGIQLKVLLRPFIFVGLFFTLIIYLNTQYLLPIAIKGSTHIEDAYFSHSHKRDHNSSLQQISLEDNTTLIYQKYNSAQELFLDVLWLRSADEIYHMKSLAPYTQVPTGNFVVKMTRNSVGQILPTERVRSQLFPEIQFEKQALVATLTPPAGLSLTTLWEKLAWHSGLLKINEAEVMVAFYRKLIIPWLCLLAVIAPAPFCVRFTRHLPIFLLFLASIFGLVMSYLMINAAAVVGKSQIIAPFWVIIAPFLLIFSGFMWRYKKLMKGI